MRLVFARGSAYPPSMPPETRYARSGDVSIAYQDRGLHELKGIPGEWQLYAAV